MSDLALVLERLQLPDLVLERHVRVDPVQLEEPDPLQPEVAQAELALLSQICRAPDRRPRPRALSGEPGLGRDHQVIRVGVQRVADQLLGHDRAV